MGDNSLKLTAKDVELMISALASYAQYHDSLVRNNEASINEAKECIAKIGKENTIRRFCYSSEEAFDKSMMARKENQQMHEAKRDEAHELISRLKRSIQK